jgi:hypothetical protein
VCPCYRAMALHLVMFFTGLALVRFNLRDHKKLSESCEYDYENISLETVNTITRTFHWKLIVVDSLEL